MVTALEAVTYLLATVGVAPDFAAAAAAAAAAVGGRGSRIAVYVEVG